MYPDTMAPTTPPRLLAVASCMRINKLASKVVFWHSGSHGSTSKKEATSSPTAAAAAPTEPAPSSWTANVSIMAARDDARRRSHGTGLNGCGASSSSFVLTSLVMNDKGTEEAAVNRRGGVAKDELTMAIVLACHWVAAPQIELVEA